MSADAASRARGSPGEHHSLKSMSGTVLVVLAGISGACINIIAKLAFRAGLDVPTFLALRAIFACAALWSLIFLLRMPMQLPARLFWRLMALGGLGYAAQSLIYNEALHRLAAGVAVLGLYTYPAFVVVFSLLMGRDRLGWIKLVALGLSLLGVALVLSVPTHGVNLVGAALALFSGLIWAVVILAAEKTTQLVSPLLFAAGVFLGMAVCLNVVGLATRQLDLGVDAAAWGWLALSALAMVITVTAFAAAIARMGAASVAIGSTFEPLATVLLAAIVLNERLSALQLIGGGLIVAALGMIRLGLKKEHSAAATTDRPPLATQGRQSSAPGRDLRRRGPTRVAQSRTAPNE